MMYTVQLSVAHLNMFYCQYNTANFYRPQRSCGRVMLSQASVSHSVHRGVRGWADTPQADTPSRWLLQRTVRILLECILVYDLFVLVWMYSWKFLHKKFCPSLQPEEVNLLVFRIIFDKSSFLYLPFIANFIIDVPCWNIPSIHYSLPIALNMHASHKFTGFGLNPVNYGKFLGCMSI